MRTALLRTLALALLSLVGPLSLASEPLPEIMVVKDDTVITQSCRVLIHPTATIQDTNSNGAIQIGADGITIELGEQGALRGAIEGAPWNTLTGIGIALNGHKNVTLRGLRVHGYKVGVWATEADGLTIDTADLSDNYRQRLKSTPAREDSSDWLFPHDNDERQWVTQHGAALCVERSNNVTIRNVLVRRGQNGIILDRVNTSRVYDNDCSFLSGWGLAMWRSSDNTISRNAFDFCVRGHSEGVYNRGQDSAGILCFEQCNRNVFVENSATHGGDGFFGFAGKEAIGERPPDAADFYSVPRGCDANTFIGNDFSYAAAHGLELTFSHRNIIASNLFIENAICGIWGGYSRDTLIANNTFTGNGGMAYGLERGGINIEHGSENVIFKNTFTNNLCGVHLWWDDDAKLFDLPGVKLTYAGVSRNVIAGNTFIMNADHPFTREGGPKPAMLGVQVRNAGGKGRMEGNILARNTFKIDAPGSRERETTLGVDVQDRAFDDLPIPTVQTIGATKPVGARSHLAGRRSIIMDAWGPWDHQSPLVRRAGMKNRALVYEVLGVKDDVALTNLKTSYRRVDLAAQRGDKPLKFDVGLEPGVNLLVHKFECGEWSEVVRDFYVVAQWSCTFFAWKEDTDPRTNLEGWRALEQSGDHSLHMNEINFHWGARGPISYDFGVPADRKIPADHFGTVARTKLKLPAGAWRFITSSDDGVRVRVDGKPVIENWTWHPPTRDEGVFNQTKEGEVEIVVEHFEIDGHAELTLEIQPGEDWVDK